MNFKDYFNDKYNTDANQEIYPDVYNKAVEELEAGEEKKKKKGVPELPKKGIPGLPETKPKAKL